MSQNCVPLNDLSRLSDDLKKGIATTVSSLAISGNYILGENVRKFEEEFAAYVGASDCIALANGTDALEIALRTVGLCSGDSVLSVANAGGYTSIAAAQIGAGVIYVDVEESSLHAKLTDFEEALNSGKENGLKPKALVVTHLFGQINPQIKEIVSFAKRNGMAVVEDCAQASGARLEGKHAGTFGDIATFSFYPTKNLGASGDAGAITTSSKKLASQAKALRQYGWTEKYQIDIAGGQNSRMDEIQAAILLAKLEHLDTWNSRRREIFGRYLEAASSDIVFTSPNDESFVAHLVVIRHSGKTSQELARDFAKHGVSTGVHYPIPDNEQEFEFMHSSVSATPVTVKQATRILTIPMFPEMTELEIVKVCEALADA